MFFFFGVGSRQQDLGPGQTRTCPRCSNTTAWRRLRQSTQLTVFFVPVARWGRQELETCGVCGESVAV